MTDPRPNIIEKRLAGIERIFVFVSGKGGVGKSSCSCLASLVLAERGMKTGLLDLDFQGASDHILLGVQPSFPEEAGGLLPLSPYRDLSFMSISSFTGERDVPLRGGGISNAVLELLAVSIWDKTEVLIIDMPPGCGDEILDVIRFIKRGEMILISTPALLSVSITRRTAALLDRMGSKVGGIIYNMTGSGLEADHRIDGIRHLGDVPYSSDFEDTIGSPRRLLTSIQAAGLETIMDKLLL